MTTSIVNEKRVCTICNGYGRLYVWEEDAESYLSLINGKERREKFMRDVDNNSVTRHFGNGKSVKHGVVKCPFCLNGEVEK